IRQRNAAGGRSHAPRRRRRPPSFLSARRCRAAATGGAGLACRILRNDGQVRHAIHRSAGGGARTDRAVRPSSPLARADLMATNFNKQISEAIEATQEEDFLRGLNLFLDTYGTEDMPAIQTSKS